MGKGVQVLCVDAREEAVGRGQGELEAVKEGDAGVCVEYSVPPPVPVPAAALIDALPMPEWRAGLLMLLEKQKVALCVPVAVPTPVALREALVVIVAALLAVRASEAVKRPLPLALGLPL